MSATDGTVPARQHTPSATVERRRRALYGALVALGALVVLALALRPADEVPDLPISEDAYYAFSVSQHLVEGDGATIDGVHPTNGFQPLFTFVSAPIFLVGSDVTALRVVLLVQGLLFVATGRLLGRIVAEAVPGPADAGGADGRATVPVLITAALYVGASFLFRTHLNGLETGFLLFLYVVLWRRYQRQGLTSTRDAVVLGAVAGLVVLARIDAVFVLVGFGVAVLGAERGRWRTMVGRLSVVAAVAGLVSSPWWLYNLIRFGSLLPTSGSAQQEWALDATRADDVVESWAQVLNPWVYLGDRFAAYWPASVLLAAVLLAVVLRLGRSTPPPADEHGAERRGSRARADTFAVALVVGGLLLTGWYALSSWAVHFYPRYLALLVLPAVYGWSRAFVRLDRRRPAIAAVGVTALVGVGLVFVGTYFVPSLNSGSSMWREQVPLVARVVPDDEVVSAGQSGTLGFFRDRVVNLDGKVNAEVTDRQDDIAAYLVEQDIRWLCDWRSYTERYLGEDPAEIGWVEAGTEGRFTCYRRP